MKFDPKKPYGVITNHSWAKYEQNGILYDTQGNTMDQVNDDDDVDELEEDIEPSKKSTRDFAYEQAQAFLKTILEGGPVARSAVFKECQANNQNWEKIKTAFSDMGGEALKRRNIIHWKLKAE